MAMTLADAVIDLQTALESGLQDIKEIASRIAPGVDRYAAALDRLKALRGQITLASMASVHLEGLLLMAGHVHEGLPAKQPAEVIPFPVAARAPGGEPPPSGRAA